MLTECMKVGQRFTLYSTSLLEHISTSLLTGKATPWRLLEREEERDVSEQPDVPGCDSPTHHWLPDWVWGGRTLGILHQRQQAAVSNDANHTALSSANYAYMQHVWPASDFTARWQKRKSPGLLIQPAKYRTSPDWGRLDRTNSDVARSRTLLEIKDEPGKIIHSSCRVSQREWERGALICFHVRVPVRPCGDRPGL